MVLWSIIQTLCIVALTLIGILLALRVIPTTYKKFILVLVTVTCFGHILAGGMIAERNAEQQEELLQRIDKLLENIGERIMEGQVLICQVISPFPPKPPGEKVEHLEIRLPAKGSEVSGQFYVEGLVPDPKADLFVIFHSIDSANYQVQPKVTVCEHNIWRVKISMEKTVGINVGSPFEIMAVANPKVKLREGDILSEWPEAQWKSQVIEVTRK